MVLLVVAIENLMGTVSISYLPAIQAAKQFEVSLGQLNTQLMNHQRLARQAGVTTASGLARQFTNEKVILDQYGRSLVNLNQTSIKASQGVEMATAAAAKQSKTVKELANSHSFLQHRFGWFASSVGFFGAINTSKLIVKTIGDVEMGMVELARISDDVTADFKQMRTELLQLGIDYGRSWTDTQDIALRWAQAATA